MNILFKGIFGSKLYGTDGEGSDTDSKGIFLVPIHECILGGYSRNINIKTNLEKNVKNSSEDSDIELYALQEFVKLALQGQTVAIDCLSTPKDKTLITSPQWEILVANRKRFYTKNMHAHLGYSKAMLLKYSCRADKLNAFKDIYTFLSKYDGNLLLKDIWGDLPEGEFYKKFTDEKDRRFFVINGKQMQEFATVDFVKQLINIQISDYGKRVRQAADNDNFDYKSIYHAFRVIYQVKQIIRTNDLIFPLPENKFLKDIKYGKYHFRNDGLGEKLEDLLDEVTKMCESSSLPEKPDRKWAEEFIISCYKNQIK